MKITILAFSLLFQFAVPLNQAFDFSTSTSFADNRDEQKGMNRTGNMNYKSVDGGQTWLETRDSVMQPVNGIFAHNGGKTWKKLNASGWAAKVAESDGILIATSQRGIVRSTDDGETWDIVISEGGVGIDVACIKGGFAAITYDAKSETRRVRTSYDGGKSWQPIDAGLTASPSIASIVEVGESLFCGHPSGIFKSSDKGKTWKLILPSVESKVFNLSVSGNVIYAIPRSGGC